MKWLCCCEQMTTLSLHFALFIFPCPTGLSSPLAASDQGHFKPAHGHQLSRGCGFVISFDQSISMAKVLLILILLLRNKACGATFVTRHSSSNWSLSVHWVLKLGVSLSPNVVVVVVHANYKWSCLTFCPFAHLAIVFAIWTRVWPSKHPNVAKVMWVYPLSGAVNWTNSYVRPEKEGLFHSCSQLLEPIVSV